MSIIQPNSIEDFIINNLQKGSLPIVKLIKIIEIARPGTTKQGVYKVIRSLKKDEVVVISNKNIGLSGVWLAKMEEFFAKTSLDKTNAKDGPEKSFLNLRPGERLQYYFRNPILTDAFWSHVFIKLISVSPSNNPVLIYNPHEWFLLARQENEMGLFNRITERGQKLAVLVDHNTPLDKVIRNNFDNKMRMYETLPKALYPKNNYYINVIADFVIEVWIDKKVGANIETFYSQTNEFGPNERECFERILGQKGRNRFSISHNKRKADAIRRKFKRYFFL